MEDYRDKEEHEPLDFKLNQKDYTTLKRLKKEQEQGSTDSKKKARKFLRGLKK